MGSDDKSVNYLLLMFVIAGGVALGNLTSNWITATYVEFKVASASAKVARAAEAAASQARDAAATAAVRQWEAEQARRREQNAEQARAAALRKADATGKKLAAICEEWKRADLDFGSYTTGTEVHRHCGRYEQYVKTGVVPR